MSTLPSADWKWLPNLLSLARIPLAAVFPFVAGRPVWALGVLCIAAVTDMLDGWVARRSGQATALGAIIDPIADKTFVLVVVATLAAHGRMPLWGVPALLAREILEAPLMVWIVVSHRGRGATELGARANVAGKLATVVQFCAVAAALLLAPAMVHAMLVVSTISGAVAGLSYWRRELLRRSSPRRSV